MFKLQAIDVHTPDHNFPVDMRTGRKSRATGEADEVARGDALTLSRQDLRHVKIAAEDTESMIENHAIAAVG
jgi:hypothetical protein